MMKVISPVFNIPLGCPTDGRRHDTARVLHNLVIAIYSRQDGGEWGEGAQLARCCRRVEFGAIAN
ncbi:hypothetical protein RR48_12944 [Papilio machaon]|uniref:Uncharacterized protein n=1 Tax=Papilio machaon TaxID=76193 RepID=A0A194QT75_PAPMA|nr:hypothetical protein RR48_12944 [Papilio machaon]